MSTDILIDRIYKIYLIFMNIGGVDRRWFFDIIG